MFLTPDGAPFFGGTYFPKEGRYGLPGFRDLLPRVAAAYRERGADIAQQAAELKDALASLEPAPAGARRAAGVTPPPPRSRSSSGGSTPTTAASARRPSFRTRPISSFASREHARTGDADALAMVRITLERMADGGIHDQLGGGFCRYSVDAEWTIPHFEKMLYDNGPLLALYADLARVTGDARFADVARGIVGWMTREMRAPDGAFFSSLDADSEGEEGKFYVWSRDEVRALLSPDRASRSSAPHFGLDGPPNFEGHAWNLRVSAPLAEVAARLSIPLAEAAARLDAAKAALFAARATRVRPGLDDKILTSWNALAIAGLARAARALDVPAWADLAVRRGGRAQAHRVARRPAPRDAQGRARAPQRVSRRLRVPAAGAARAHADALSRRGLRVGAADRRRPAGRVRGPADGGFFFTSHDHERLFHRTKPGHDNATPFGQRRGGAGASSCSAICAPCRATSRRASARCVFSRRRWRARPPGYASMLAALADLVDAADVRAAGRRRGDTCAAVAAGARSARFDPACASSTSRASLARRARQGRGAGDGARAWVCRGTHACRRSTSLAGARSASSEWRADRVDLVRGWRIRWRQPFRYHSARFPHHSLMESAMKIAAVVLAAGLLATGAARAADAGEELMKKSGCTACHAIDKKVVGPAYKEVAAKYRGNAGAAAMLAEKVKKGGSRASGARCRCRRTRRCPTPTSRRWSPTSSR